MNNVSNFLKLIRLPNLLIIAATMYIVRYGIVYALLKINNFNLQLNEVQFFLLALSTVMIAASGYIINDYFDIKIDRINNPKKNIVGVFIKRRVAMGAHIVINILALLIAAYVAYSINFFKLIFIQFIAAGMLWYYSVSFKKQAFLGNFIIALLAALVPFIAGFYDILLLHTRAEAILMPFLINLNETEINEIFIQYKNSLNNIFGWIAGYSLFAFLLNFAREICKDCEDIEGDKEHNCRTIPIAFGIQNANYIITSVILISTFSLGYFANFQFKTGNTYFILYAALAVQIPLLWITYKTIKANTKKDYSIISKYLKYIMIAGILYIPVFYFTVLYA
jgi:4-hydroxybenzoate polyprenyltransferase